MTEANTILDSLEADQWNDLYRCRYDRKHRNKTIPILAKLLKNPEPKIYQRTLRAVGRIGPCDTVGALSVLVPIVCDSVSNADLLTRRTAVAVLAGIGRDRPKATVPALVKACQDDALLDAALLALIELGQEARPALACFHQYVTHPQGKIRRLVIRGLEAIGADDRQSKSILKSSLDDSNKQVREMAHKVLSRSKSRKK